MENGPILKKVRRPINRRMPVSPNEQPFDNKVSESGVENKNDINIPQVENKAPAPEPAPAPAPRISLPSVERAPVQGRQENFDYNEPQYADNEYYDEYAPAQHNGVSTTVLIVSVLVCLAMGLIIGRFLFSENQTTHSGFGFLISISLLCVRISNCSRESLYLCTALKIVNFSISVGSGTGPEITPPDLLTVSTIFLAALSSTL